MTSLRGRPKSYYEVVIFRISLSLRKGEDDDLIAFLSSKRPRKRAIAVKTRLRLGKIESAEDYSNQSDDLDQTIQGLVF
ncbi:MAG: hypothetical protein CVU42_00130 [Chloroflexi bacterium HGW-Chloroflexi-4]|nr:MAG: hypothetical protein CVU42_00130 [Chloroflexi bacterium HGW-Chloroflexi-4]